MTMFETPHPIRLAALSIALASASLGAFAQTALGQIIEPPHAMLQPKALIARPQAAAVAPVLMKDVDQAARAPFQTSVTVSVSNFVVTPVPIPAGQRLVIDYISINGAAQTSGPYVQPIVVVTAGVANNPGVNYYFGPNPSATAPGQYYHSEQTTIYADSLSVSPAFAGYTPSFMTMVINISGHLITP